MYKYLLAILILSGCSTTLSKQDRETILEIQTSAFYTGCVDGFIVTYEQGWYKRPKNNDPKMIYQTLKEQCATKSLIYKIEQREMYKVEK